MKLKKITPGYREFDSYLTSEDPSPQSFVDATEDMKRSTRQYAKRQIKWFKNKFLPVASAANRQARSLIEDEKANGTPEDMIHTYVLDATGKYLFVKFEAANARAEESNSPSLSHGALKI